MGIFTFLDRTAGDSKLVNDWRKFGDTGQSSYASGSLLTEEGLGGLRALDKTYSDRINDPLGAVGRGIFTRARGGLQDDFTRMVNSGDAQAAQLARQSGGSLTPEQVAALDAQNRRGAGERLFSGTADIADAEATATLTEQGKLFDRLEGIRKSEASIGLEERNQGLRSILDAMLGRTDRMKAIWGDVTSAGVAAARG